MGGYTALAFAVQHPDRTAALVLCDTRADADPPAMRAARNGAIARIRDLGVDAYLPGSIPRLLSPDAPPALWAHLLARAEARAASLIAGIEALRDRPDRSAQLAALRCPTLIVRGTRRSGDPCRSDAGRWPTESPARGSWRCRAPATCLTSKRRDRSWRPSAPFVTHAMQGGRS